MKKSAIRPFLLTLMLLSLGFLVACGTNEPTQEDALSELEAIADANGDIEISLDIRFTPDSSELRTAYYEYQLKNFQATTPKGKTLEGLILLPEGFEEIKVSFQNVKLRGKVTHINGNKVFSGFVIANGGGLGVVPLMAYREGTSIQAPNAGNTSFQMNAEFVKRDDGIIAMVTRNQQGSLLSLISEDLGLQNKRSKQQVQLELTAQIDGLISQEEAQITLDNGIKFTASVVGHVYVQEIPSGLKVKTNDDAF